MMHTNRLAVVGLVAALGMSALAACGGGSGGKAGAKTATAPGGSKDPSQWPADDRSMCDFRNKPELEVAETAGPGALKPNVRRVYKTFGDGDSRHKTLICREIDTNLDGIKDVVRTFNPKGEAMHEESDSNYDGKVDIWINFVDGRMAEEDVDTNGDGKPDVWKFYVNGQLQRIRRDRNFDGKPDVWEIYAKGRLERVGMDETFDGHVDRWDRDEQLKYEAEAADRKARDEMMNAQMAKEQAAKEKGAETSDAGAPTATDAGAPKGVAPKTPPKK
ncbi:MAG: hypothetical protein JST00_11175 [Deltaproteobacteria bacterium]|nr:hypothetical protein [Deltaproteobacteria bacterium]